MSKNDPRIGVRNLKGSAASRFERLRDDNDSHPASEEEALARFAAIEDSFFSTQAAFIAACERKAPGEAD